MINGLLEAKIRRDGFKGDIRREVSMREITSFKIGGPADRVLFPRDPDDLTVLMRLFREEGVRYLVLGNGTNLLVSDRGVQEPLINLSSGFGEIKKEGTTVIAGGGVGFPRLLRFCADNALDGLEYLAGIPGTVGGGIRMNVGSWGVEVGNLISSVTVMDQQGRTRRLPRDELLFEYRGLHIPAEEIIIQGAFTLHEGEEGAIKERMGDFVRRRKETQPLSVPSAGSIFKNPSGIPAGKLIEEAGLKGLRRGDAMVSPLHANFIVNLGRARSGDVLGLIELIRGRVYQETGVMLELEVVIVGEPSVAE